MSKSRFKLFSVLIGMLFVLGITSSNLLAAQATPKPKNSNSAAGSSSASGAKLDLNTASEKDLVELPGVGAATAKKIIAGRPYSSVDGLSKAGVSASTISKISALVTVGGASAAPAASAKSSPPAPPVSRPASTPSSQPTPAAGAKVDLNLASEKDLVDLPGVGPATAKKIIAGRPYSSVDGLSKAGVSASTISKISSLVTVSGAPAAPPVAAKASPPPPPTPPVSQPASAPASRPTPAAPPAASPAKPATTAAAQGNPGPGMVWVNVDSGVYHYQGSRYYGTTKTGKYMSESDALAAGYHAAKNEKKPQ